jgi:hypothetical protein
MSGWDAISPNLFGTGFEISDLRDARLLRCQRSTQRYQYNLKAVVYNSSLRHGYCNHSASSVVAQGVKYPVWALERPWESRAGADKGSSGCFPKHKVCFKTRCEARNDRQLIMSALVKALPLPLVGPLRVVYVSPGRGIANWSSSVCLLKQRFGGRKTLPRREGARRSRACP